MSDEHKPYLTKDDPEWESLDQGEKVRHGKLKAEAERQAQAVESRGSDEHLQEVPGSDPAAAADESVPSEKQPVGESAEERRRRLLGDVPPDLAARITEAQLDKLEADKKRIEEEEQERATYEVLKRVLEDIRGDAKVRARVAAGLVPEDVLRTEAELRYMNEEIEFRIDVPLGAMPSGKEGIHVNGFLYQYNLIYKRPRHVFASLHETMYRAQMAELKFSLMNQQKPGMSAGHVYNKTPLRVIVSEPKAVPHAA